MTVWKIGAQGEICCVCKAQLTGAECASSNNIRVCRDCFRNVGPHDCIMWMLEARGEPRDVADVAASDVIKELYDYGMIICHRKSICSMCGGSGRSIFNNTEKCTKCNGEGDFDCVSCGNTGIASNGARCQSCRK